MATLIKQAIIINEGTEKVASLLIEGDIIKEIVEDNARLQSLQKSVSQVIEADGMFLIPGVIDDHVHMRDPGLTHKADMHTETLAAAAGGVTSVMDMPNVVPQTTTLKLWEEKMQHATNTCHVNYAFYLGATNDNLQEIKQMDTTRIPALKLFMGSSTGGMLVDQEELLREIFAQCPTLIMTHCEDTARINKRMQQCKAEHGEDPAIEWHPWVRDDEACYMSSALAVKLACETGARLHIAHITTQKELSLLEDATTPLTEKKITAEVCPQHLRFSDKDYKTQGSLIKCNPAIKSEQDCKSLLQAAIDHRLDVIGTDHAPHLLSEKQGGAAKAVSGMPIIQFSLPLMFTLSESQSLKRTRLVEMMCHNPALLFNIQQRGFIRPGYKADIVLLKKEKWTVQENDILSKCGWSPLSGQALQWRIQQTWCNGHLVFDGTSVDENYHGEALRFNP